MGVGFFKNWLSRPPVSVQADVPILYLDCDVDFENDKDRQDFLIKEVETYLEQLRK